MTRSITTVTPSQAQAIRDQALEDAARQAERLLIVGKASHISSIIRVLKGTPPAEDKTTALVKQLRDALENVLGFCATKQGMEAQMAVDDGREALTAANQFLDEVRG